MSQSLLYVIRTNYFIFIFSKIYTWISESKVESHKHQSHGHKFNDIIDGFIQNLRLALPFSPLYISPAYPYFLEKFGLIFHDKTKLGDKPTPAQSAKMISPYFFRFSEIDTRMKFSIQPPPGESAFDQWRDAMKAVCRLPMGIPSEFRKKVGYFVSLSENLGARTQTHVKALA